MFQSFNFGIIGVNVVDEQSSYGSGSWSTLCKSVIFVAVEASSWISNSWGDTVKKTLSLVEVWAMFEGADGESCETCWCVVDVKSTN